MRTIYLTAATLSGLASKHAETECDPNDLPLAHNARRTTPSLGTGLLMEPLDDGHVKKAVNFDGPNHLKATLAEAEHTDH